jgi:hypothetical protein
MSDSAIVFLLCLDPLRSLEMAEFEDFLNRQTAIDDWLHDIPGCYYLFTTMDEVALTDLVQDALSSPQSFLISKLNPDFNGLLSEQSWKFLRRITSEEN